MNMTNFSTKIKALSREKLLLNLRLALYSYLIIELSILILTSIMSPPLNYNSIGGRFLGFGIIFLCSFIVAIFTLGKRILYLSFIGQTESTLKMIFYGFKNTPDRVICVHFIITSSSLLCLLPSLFFYDTFLFWIFFLAGIIGFIWIQLSFSQSLFLLVDFPEMSPKNVLLKSLELMYHNKLKLLYIYGSFIPLYIIGILSFSLGLVLVVPYKDMTLTYFYLNLIRTQHKL
ncbi:MAG: hypothetical protein ACRC7V_06615 [Lachnospiraceae bacterium]